MSCGFLWVKIISTCWTRDDGTIGIVTSLDASLVEIYLIWRAQFRCWLGILEYGATLFIIRWQYKEQICDME